MIRKYLAAIGMVAVLGGAGTAVAEEMKPRIIVLTDICPITVEPDDTESMIRLLAHADLFEIEGLVASTGWSIERVRDQPYPNFIKDIIGAYEKDLPNLKKRSNQTEHLADEGQQKIGYWPSPEYLRSRTVVGSKKRGMSFIGKENDSAGSELIIKAADEKDERPVWVLVWGGGNTLAQAVWRVQQDRTPEQLKTFLRRVRTYTITDQDRGQGRAPFEGSSHYWLRKEFKDDLQFLWDEAVWTFQNSTGKTNWEKYAAQIQNHGNLGAIYPKYKYGVEGDTPSFLYVWPNGLNDPEHPEHGGWGGLFERGVGPDKATTSWVNQQGTPSYTVSRKHETKFYPAIFNNFAARMAWAKDGAGNRNPEVVVNGESGLGIVKISAEAGKVVTLDASATKDPDGDKLTYAWWVMTEAGTYTKEVTLAGSDSSVVKVNVPGDLGRERFHVICEVTDGGTPALTSYRRVVIEGAR